MSTNSNVQIVCRAGMVFAAPLHGTKTTKRVTSADCQDVTAVATAIEGAVTSIPAAQTDEVKPSSRSPFQVVAGVSRIADWERGLRMIFLSLFDDRYELTRMIPYTGGRSGFESDRGWKKTLTVSVSFLTLAKLVVDTFNDPEWKAR